MSLSLLIGVILSPTDPIAVMSILNACYVPDKLRVLISGESLFNDGISYSVFIILASLKFGGLELSIESVSEVLLKEIVLSIFSSGASLIKPFVTNTIFLSGFNVFNREQTSSDILPPLVEVGASRSNSLTTTA